MLHRDHQLSAQAAARLLMATLLLVATAGLSTAWADASAQWTDYRITALIDPPRHGLEAEITVTVPVAAAGQTVEFVLAANLPITGSSLPIEKRPTMAGDEVFAGINGSSEAVARRRGVNRYRVTLPVGGREFTLRYAGVVDMQPETGPEEYARGFAETPGIVDPKGVYLAGSTLWYPQLLQPVASELMTYSLAVNTPAGWHLIAPGDGTSSGADGKARWHSPSAVDEITLSGGPLTTYTAQAGKVEAQVYLRQDDPSIAAKYLDATSRYLHMYSELLGPYPYEKFALVENFWETDYGMPSYALLGQQIIRFPFILTSSYPQEILHNWWGNSVYVDYQSGNWCEGLTAYLADHLMKEVEGHGAEYRRDTLKKYRDFAAGGTDFPLRDFRARYSGATEAVGYGKTLMGFHMLRRDIGDKAFRDALTRFYEDYRGTRASFTDVRTAFEAVSGRNLSRFFSEWVERSGAADLAVEGVKTRKSKGNHVVSGTILQRQDGPYALSIPMVVTTEDGAVSATIVSQGVGTPFSIETTARPLSLAVDPEFDLFRMLDPRETAPSIEQLSGAAELVAVVPKADEAAWREMLKAWQNPTSTIEIVRDSDISDIPGDRSVWILGKDNRLAARLFGSDPALGLKLSAKAISIDGEAIPFEGHSHVLTRRHPEDPRLAIAWVTAASTTAIADMGRKLPHYGKYSWLAFSSDDSTNIGKGEWPATDSPLLVNLQRKNQPVVMPAPEKRPALAEPPAQTLGY